MADILLFGGTSEGRLIAERLAKGGFDACVCVATDYGEALLPEGCRVHAGRLSERELSALYAKERPRVVIDATHPYAAGISETIRGVCGENVIRVRRERESVDGCVTFAEPSSMIDWLNTRDGVIFSALGAKEAPALSKVRGFRERVWVRVLPDVSSLQACVDAGFPPKHVICMQGPFGKELNYAMFAASGAEILLTKESGGAGGFDEKAAAARARGMAIAVLLRPGLESGVTLTEILKIIGEGEL